MTGQLRFALRSIVTIFLQSIPYIQLYSLTLAMDGEEMGESEDEMHNTGNEHSGEEHLQGHVIEGQIVDGRLVASDGQIDGQIEEIVNPGNLGGEHMINSKSY